MWELLLFCFSYVQYAVAIENIVFVGFIVLFCLNCYHVSTPDCGVRDTRIESPLQRVLCFHESNCDTQLRAYIALCIGCTPLLQCLSRLRLLPSVGQYNGYQPYG